MTPCFMISETAPPGPKIQIVYICVTHGAGSGGMAGHFVSTYRQFPAGAEHTVTVICNGGELSPVVQKIFDGTGFAFFPRSNDGFDIGGYLDFARRTKTDADLLLCLGESVYFHRAGWLARIVEAFNQFGPGMYGCFSSYLSRAHMNTTAFAVSPGFLRQYPNVLSREDRYGFEHGQFALWRRIAAAGYPTKFVTWSGFWDPNDWRKPPNILWTGNQSDLLVFSNHTDRWFAAPPATKLNWEQGANRFVG
jgi:hypothetical protein